MTWAPDRVNVNGGAIAIGYPSGGCMGVFENVKVEGVQRAIDFLRRPVSRKVEIIFYTCALLVTVCSGIH